MDVDWGAIERAWLESVTRSIVATVRSNPGECLYAGAFWLLYGDYASIHAPAFSLSPESSDPDLRWHPPDWRWSNLDAPDHALRALYAPLLTLDVDEAVFDVLWEEHIGVLARVSHAATRLVRTGEVLAEPSAFAQSFFVGIIDFAQGDVAFEYLRRSVDEELLVASGILDFYA